MPYHRVSLKDSDSRGTRLLSVAPVRAGALEWSQWLEETVAKTLNLLGLSVSTFSKSRL